MFEGIQINNIRTTAIDQDINLITLPKAPYTLHHPKLSHFKIFKWLLHIDKCIAIRFLLTVWSSACTKHLQCIDPNYVFLCSFIPFYDLKVSITLLTEKFRVEKVPWEHEKYTQCSKKVSITHKIFDQKCNVAFHSGCQASGVYGNNCTEQCPPNCRDKVCHIQKRTCFGCAPGWIDTMCYTSKINFTF